MSLSQPPGNSPGSGPFLPGEKETSPTISTKATTKYPSNISSARPVSPNQSDSLQSRPEALPDVASDMAPDFTGDLERVGMSGIELATSLELSDGKQVYLPAFGDAYVSLDNPQAKGIHMSRLFLQLDENCQRQPLSPALLSNISDQFLKTHDGISLKADLQIQFRLPVRRSSLLTSHTGQRHYPIKIGLHVDRKTEPALKKIWLEVEVTYSSTCPCSAALSRQLLQKHFQHTIGKSDTVSSAEVSQWLLENGSLATPHSQRSIAIVKVQLDADSNRFPAQQLIEKIENCLQTPVQAVVKRIDEQEFARLNGSNLMFCEDAARRMKSTLDTFEDALDFRIEARHLESLHPHDAVAVATKGIAGGFQA